INGKLREDLILGSGKWDLLKMEGNIKGRVLIEEALSYNSYFAWNGNFNSWDLEFFSQISSLKYKNQVVLKSPKFHLYIDSSGKIDGYFLSNEEGDSFLELKLEGPILDWKASLIGGNINLMGANIKEVKVDLDKDLSGSFYVDIDKVGEISFNFRIFTDVRKVKFTGLKYGDMDLGDGDLLIDENKISFEARILQGNISGYYDFSNKGNIDFSNLKIGDIDISGKCVLKDEKILLQISYLNIGGIEFKDISAESSLENISQIQNLSFSTPYDFSGTGNIKLGENIEGYLNLQYKDLNLGKIDIIGSLNLLNIKGEILDGNLSGSIDLDKYEISLKGENIDLYLIKGLPLSGKIGAVELNISDNILDFNGNTDNISIGDLNVKNVSFHGTYDKILNFAINGDVSPFNLSVSGKFDKDIDFQIMFFPLKGVVPSYLENLLNLTLSGKVEDIHQDPKISLSLVSHNIPDLKNFDLLVDLKDDGKIEGKGSFANEGNLGLHFNLNGDGDVKWNLIPLSILKAIGVDYLIGTLSGTVNFEKWNFISSSIELNNLEVSYISGIGIKFNVKKEDEIYKLEGDIDGLSEVVSRLEGSISNSNFNIKLSLNDLKILEGIIPKEIVSSGNLKDGKMVIEINGDGNKQKIIGKLSWRSPIVFNYVNDKVYGGSFIIENENGNLKLKELVLSTFNSDLRVQGDLLPVLNLDLTIKDLCLNIPDLVKGYLNATLNIKSSNKEYLLSGNVRVYNTHIFYPQGEIKIAGDLPKLPLNFDIKISLGENVTFSEANFLNFSLEKDLKLTGDLNKPILSGEIDFKDGTINVLGNEFILDYGYIKFPGLSFEENIWEVSASTLIQGFLINLKAYSFMGNTSVLFTSEPSLSLKEILFLLVGQKNLPIAQVESWTLSTLVESIPVGVQGMISSAFNTFFLNPVLSEFAKVFNLDSLTVEYTIEGLIPHWRSIILEKKLSDLFSAKLNYSLDERTWSGELDYEFRKDFSLKLFTTENKGFSFFLEYSSQF
ncbi:MAG TPA: translocation/assembly module TamB domain-containing protein, partial [Dictyoglomaceae bacterium]|nr:translocation/assembly module TamB domain-containing protein [Dictyoglomaceae bacterium]